MKIKSIVSKASSIYMLCTFFVTQSLGWTEDSRMMKAYNPPPPPLSLLIKICNRVKEDIARLQENRNAETNIINLISNQVDKRKGWSGTHEKTLAFIQNLHDCMAEVEGIDPMTLKLIQIEMQAIDFLCLSEINNTRPMLVPPYSSRELLHSAVIMGDYEAVHFLLTSGANPDAKTFFRHFTAVHLAVIFNHSEILQLLLDKGANINSMIEMPYGYLFAYCVTALELAKELQDQGWDRSNIIKILENTPEINKLEIDGGSYCNIQRGIKKKLSEYFNPTTSTTNTVFQNSEL